MKKLWQFLKQLLQVLNASFCPGVIQDRSELLIHTFMILEKYAVIKPKTTISYKDKNYIGGTEYEVEPEVARALGRDVEILRIEKADLPETKELSSKLKIRNTAVTNSDKVEKKGKKIKSSKRKK